MSYNKKIWKNGDLITKEGMNNIENGIYNAHSQINTINNKVENNTNDTNTARQDISDIKLQIGTEELTTNAKEVKGAINEVNSQIKEKANKNEVREKDVLIDTKDITDTLRQQITGNAPISNVIEDFSVQPIKTNFFDIEVDYTNLLNVNAQINGLLESTTDGSLNQGEAFKEFKTIEWIRVTENTDYTFSIDGICNDSLYISAVCFYDTNKTFLSGMQNKSQFTTPPNCAYLSVSMYGGFVPKSQLEIGTSATPFVEYKKIKHNDGIKEEHMPKITRKINTINNFISEIVEYEYIKLDLNIKNGYYQENALVSNSSYESVKLDVKHGEKYKIDTYILGVTNFPVARFYDSKFNEVGNSGLINTDSAINNYEVVIPENIAFMTVTNRVDGGVVLKVQKYSSVVKINKPTQGLKYIAIGDSITAQSDSWRNRFIEATGAEEIMCTAVSGAHLADYSDTVLDGTNFEGSGNTVCNQIQKILNNPPSQSPDFIIISAITNDNLEYDQLVNDKDMFIGSYFPNYMPLENVDRTTIEGAMRWQVEKLYSLYPKVQIFFASPIQGYDGIRPVSSIIMKQDKMKRIAQKMAIPVIEAATNCGIYGRYEKNGTEGKYLIDGLHPNKAGSILLGNYYAKCVINHYSFI